MSSSHRTPQAETLPLRGAFTLVECVFALAVTAAALAWLLSASRYAAEASSVASGRVRAATLAASLVEEVQFGGVRPAGNEGVFDEAPGYRWELRSAEQGDDATCQGCRRVMLRVTFPGMSGADEFMDFVFLVAYE